MTKLPINYSKSVIYKIVCKNPEIEDFYIGSTTNLTQRKYTHDKVIKLTLIMTQGVEIE